MMWGYVKKCFHIYIWNLLQWVNRHVLPTYSLIEECGRCDDCGRNVHDYDVPNKLWLEVTGSEDNIYCYDCFCNRADKKFGVIEKGTLVSNSYCVEKLDFKWRLGR